jgi:hypothetical protein
MYYFDDLSSLELETIGTDIRRSWYVLTPLLTRFCVPMPRLLRGLFVHYALAVWLARHYCGIECR